MTPTHHPPEEWLLGHATGALTEAVDLLVASHATLCPECRTTIRALEAAAGDKLAQLQPSPLVGGLEALLARLPEQDVAGRLPRKSEHDFPSPLLEYVPEGPLSWRFLAPGVHQIQLPLSEGEMPVRLLRLAPGLAVPAHRHTGFESQLVLAGGYDDEQGTFVRGDLGWRGEEGSHVQRIHRDGHCIALVVADHPLIPVGLKSTILSWFVRA